MDSVVESLVQEWLRLDKNPSTRAEIEKLYGERNIEELGKRLLNRISFGTAGIKDGSRIFVDLRAGAVSEKQIVQHSQYEVAI
ncbi:13665_t:CDS:2 [Entrophospora sp. SA101]|nr:13665_t:CDS:2 [Entrophospora sp. SA101]